MKSESDKWSSGYLNCQQVHDQINPTGTPKIEGPQEVRQYLKPTYRRAFKVVSFQWRTGEVYCIQGNYL